MNDTTNNATLAPGDLGLLIKDSLADRIVDAIEFPVLVRVPASAASTRDEDSLGEAELEFGVDRADIPELSEINEAFEACIVEMVNVVRDGEIDTTSADPEQLAALRKLVKISESAAKSAYYNADPAEIDSALKVLVSKASVSVDVQWVKVEVGKPAIALANPIILSGMTFKVQARIKACIRILGKKICVTVASPWVRLEARQGRLELSSSGARVLALPQFKDLDIVIKIRIWKWTINIRIGVTSLVNSQLRKQGPVQLLDLSSLETPVPFGSKHVRVDGFDFPSDPQGLFVRASMAIR